MPHRRRALLQTYLGTLTINATATGCIASVKTDNAAIGIENHRALRDKLLNKYKNGSLLTFEPLFAKYARRLCLSTNTAAYAPHLRLYRSRMTNIEKDRRSGLLFRLRQAYQPQGFI